MKARKGRPDTDTLRWGPGEEEAEDCVEEEERVEDRCMGKSKNHMNFASRTPLRPSYIDDPMRSEDEGEEELKIHRKTERRSRDEEMISITPRRR